MKRLLWIGTGIIVVTAVVWIAVRLSHRMPVAVLFLITRDEVLNASMPIGIDEPATVSTTSVALHDGAAVYSEEAGKIGSGAREDVSYSLDRDLISIGDLNGDGEPDAIAVLTTNYGGGSGQYVHLVAFSDQKGVPVFADVIDLGDRTTIDSVQIQEGEISVIYRTWKGGEYSPQIHERYALQNSRLVKL